jgi:hypothetical protein
LLPADQADHELSLPGCSQGHPRVACPAYSTHDAAQYFGKDATRPMGGCPTVRCWLTLLSLTLPIACSAAPAPSARDVADANDTGRTLNARSESERALLAEAGALPNTSSRRFGSTSVSAEPPYTAASGRTCRVLHITDATSTAARERLVCSTSNGWLFVPDVFGAEDDAGRP